MTKEFYDNHHNLEKGYFLLYDFRIITKSNLKSGMVVELNNKERYLVCGNKLISKTNYLQLDDYSKDLLNEKFEKYNINKVFTKLDFGHWVFDDFFFIDADLNLIWERTVEFTCDKCNSKSEILSFKKINTSELLVTYVCTSCREVHEEIRYLYL